MNEKFLLALFASALMLAACGGDNGSNGTDPIDGKDGVSGSDGKDGTNGKDGTSCELKIAKDSTYYEISCGEESISVPLNGNSGQNSGSEIDVGSDEAYLTFDRRAYVGINSAAKITMKNAALKGDSVVVQLCADRCENIALHKDKDMFTKTLYLNGSEGQRDNFTVTEHGQVKVNYADLDVNLADSAVWLLKAQGYVQFGQDVYTSPFYQPTIYLYDDDNLNDFAYVTVYSSKNRNGVKVKLNRYDDYFYGTFEMSAAGGSAGVLKIEDGKKIGVAYYDSSMAKTQTDSATIKFLEYVYLTFGDTLYSSYEDKAVINLTDYLLTTQMPVSVNVWSDSDINGCNVELYPASGGFMGYMRIGFVEFVNRKTDKTCALYVVEGDKIYAEYESAYGSKRASTIATWGKAGVARSSSSSSVKSSSSVASSSSAKSSSSVAYGSFIDARDVQVYKTVKIGSQTWMAENLNYEYDKGTAKSYCYDNSTANCDKYGRLYTWAAAMDSAGAFSTAGKGCGYGESCSAASASSTTLVRGVCPDGWHLPNNTEWRALLTALDGKDEFGFFLLPAGHRNGFDNYYYQGNYAYLWSSSEYNGNFAYYLFVNEPEALMDNYNKDFAFSVRCLKD